MSSTEYHFEWQFKGHPRTQAIDKYQINLYDLFRTKFLVEL